MSVEYICWYWIYHANSCGDECKLVSFCVPFGRMVGEYIYFKIYLCVGYIYAANNFGSICKLNIYVGVGYSSLGMIVGAPTVGG